MGLKAGGRLHLAGALAIGILGCGGNRGLPRDLALLLPADSLLAACADSNRATGQTICRAGGPTDRWELGLDSTGSLARLVRSTQVPIARFESQFRDIRRQYSAALGPVAQSGSFIYQWRRPPFTLFAIRGIGGGAPAGESDSTGIITSELVRSAGIER